MAATRFYLPSSSTAPVTPAFSAGWDVQPAPDRAALVRSKGGTALAFTAQAAGTETVDVFSNVLIRQYVSADTIPTARVVDGTLSAVVGGFEGSTAANASLQIIASVVSGDGATVRGVLYAGATDPVSATVGAQTEEFSNSSSSSPTRIWSAIPVSPVVAQAGDRVVVEVGWLASNTTTTSSYVRLRLGDPTSGDHALTSGVNSSTLAPWVEFSADLFGAVDTSVSVNLPGTLPALAGSFSGSVPQPVDATTAATLPRLSGTFSGQVVSNTLPYRTEVMADNPAAYYRLGEPNTVAKGAFTGGMVDSSGNNRHGDYRTSVTLGSAGLLVGDGDTSATFNTDTQSFAAAPSSWATGAGLAVEAVIHPTSSGTLRRVIDWGRSNFSLHISAAGNLQVYSYDTTDTLRVLDTTAAVPTGTKSHVAATYDGTTARLYLNGAEVGAFPLTNVRATADNFIIGADPDSGGHFVGRIDEVAFYDHAVSAARIGTHYASSISAPTTFNADVRGTLPQMTGTFAGDVPTQANLAGLLPALTGGFSGELPDTQGEAELVGTLPALTGSFEAVEVVSEDAAVDTSDRANGRTRTGRSFAVVEYPLDAEPPNRVPIRSMAQSAPAPTLVDGRPS